MAKRKNWDKMKVIVVQSEVNEEEVETAYRLLANIFVDWYFDNRRKSMIRIENRSKYKGQGIYVGRTIRRSKLEGSPLGNPFILENKTSDLERRASIADYRTWLEAMLSDPKSEQSKELERLCSLYKENKELILICWCAPLPCHAEVIREKILERIG